MSAAMDLGKNSHLFSIILRDALCNQMADWERDEMASVFVYVRDRVKDFFQDAHDIFH